MLRRLKSRNFLNFWFFLEDIIFDLNLLVNCDEVKDEFFIKEEKYLMDDLYGDDFIRNIEKLLSVYDRI